MRKALYVIEYIILFGPATALAIPMLVLMLFSMIISPQEFISSDTNIFIGAFLSLLGLIGSIGAFLTLVSLLKGKLLARRIQIVGYICGFSTIPLIMWISPVWFSIELTWYYLVILGGIHFFYSFTELKANSPIKPNSVSGIEATRDDQ